MQSSSLSAGKITYIELLFLIVIGWIIVSQWERVIENFAFNTVGLDKDSTSDTLVIAIVITTIFLAYIFLVGDQNNAVSIVSISPMGGSPQGVIDERKTR